MDTGRESGRCLPLHDQIPDLGLPHEQEEDEEPVQAVQYVREVGVLIRQLHCEGEQLGQPGDAHHDEQSEVEAKPDQWISVF